MHSPTSWFEVWALYQESVHASCPAGQVAAVLAQAQSALFRYTLPGLGWSRSSEGSVTKPEREAASALMQQLSIEQLRQAMEAQQQVFDRLEVPKQTQRTYRYALKRWLEWCEQQPWWCGEPLEQPSRSRRPKQQRSAAQVRMTNRQRRDDQGQPLYPYKYALGKVSGDEIPAALQQELAAFRSFRTTPQPVGLGRPVQEATAQDELQQICLVLGWLHRYRKVPLTELNLRHLVPFVPIAAAQDREAAMSQAELAAEQTLKLANDYLSWLQADPKAKDPKQAGRGSSSVHTWRSVLRVFLVVARFIYRQELAGSPLLMEGQVPVLCRLRSQILQLSQQVSQHPSINALPEKQVEWSAFLAVVEQLRQECQPRLFYQTHTRRGGMRLGSSRSLEAIAFSYQRFLLAALMSYLAPRRSYQYRTLQVQKPEVTASLSEPAVTESAGLLFEKDGIWHICWQMRASRSAAVRQEQVVIPNLQYPEGRCFYDYLQDWLVQYPNEEGTVSGLRSVFNPNHSYLFTKKDGQPYGRANAFKHLLRTPTYRLAGKVPTPETLRLVFEAMTEQYPETTNLDQVARDLAQAQIESDEDGSPT